MSEIQTRGIPSVYIATIDLRDGGLGQAKALGADPAAVFVEHPIQDRTDEEMLGIADKAFDALVAKLVA